MIVKEYINKYPILASSETSIRNAIDIIKESLEKGGKVLVCGNGGSCSDADHICGEFLKGFLKKRKLDSSLKNKMFEIYGEKGKELADALQCGLPCINLCAHNALSTAVSNDLGEGYVYAQQVMAYGKANDVIIGISTSGNAQNVINAFVCAKSLGVKVIALTGETGGKMRDFADCLINVSAQKTPDVQELHLPVYHAVCASVEEYFFKGE